MRCQAALFELLLKEDYDFLLTSRFQSDLPERRVVQHRFLLSAKDVEQSEEILKIKALINEGFDFTPEFKCADSLTAVEP